MSVTVRRLYGGMKVQIFANKTETARQVRKRFKDLIVIPGNIFAAFYGNASCTILRGQMKLLLINKPLIWTSVVRIRVRVNPFLISGHQNMTGAEDTWSIPPSLIHFWFMWQLHNPVCRTDTRTASDCWAHFSVRTHLQHNTWALFGLDPGMGLVEIGV